MLPFKQFSNSFNVEIMNAVFTPMFEDGSINYSRIPALCQQARGTGADGVFINGTTGECMSLSVQERLKIVEAWTECRQNQSPALKMFVHVGSCNVYEAAQMAEHAQAHGADGIAMVAPFYFRPKTLEDVVGQCEYVAAAAPNTPFYYYNIPSLTGVNFPLIKFLELAPQRIPNFAGLKNSFTDIVDYQHCIHFAKDNYALYWGTDEVFMMLYAAGNRHYVGSTYNYMSNIYLEMLKACHAGAFEKLTALEGEADAIYKILLSYNGLIAGKEVMRYLGIDCGPVRRPLNPLTRPEREALYQKLNDTTFFKYIPEGKSVDVTARSS
jgi:N-acetylneuraminate lyase